MSTWVLLRGLTRESRHWGAFPQALAAAVPGARVLTPDLAGNGSLHAIDSPLTVEAMAADCRARLLAQGARPPFSLLAMSLGAMVAVAWAQQHPAEISRCVLINTSLRPFSPFHQRLRPRNYATLLRLVMQRGDEPAREALVLALTSRLAHSDASLLDHWAAYARECPVSGRNALRQLFAAARYRALQAQPDVPLLVLTAAQDGLVDTRCSLRLAQHWSTAMAVHPQAGHDIPLDDGPWVVEQVVAWLRAASNGGALPAPPPLRA